ncbi:DMT family transporter [Luteibacter aegosomaticola]|uniref:DMT family transporter n=1 Tax=Luteibacter aegosomaticola TaxID=2911538 RepID=UPI001FF76BC3|nr:DMT family transporter [Luteibacter aegosomaticola]UPG89995.1 DMT family transporter [Luteibacter aegosomaticola]
MLTIVMVILAVLGGAFLSVQAAVNGRLAATQGALRATFITFLVGTLVSGVLVIFIEPPHAVSLLDVPKWQLTGSFLGLIYVLTMGFAVQRIGASIATVAVILGQLAMSIIIDTLGWLGNTAIPLSMNRVAAAVLLLIALWFIYTSSDRAPASSSKANSH